MFDTHRLNLISKIGSDLAFLKGGVSSCWYDSDTDIKFRQESNFYYITGCLEPDCCALIDGKSKEFMLFVPKLGPDHELWMGRVQSIEEQQEAYQAKICYINDMQSTMAVLGNRKCHIIKGIPQIPDEPLPFTDCVNDLQQLIAELRVIKDESEIADLRESCAINAKAHNYVMSHLKIGMMEYEAEAQHAYIYLKNGARFPSFCSITAAGPNCSTLHFVNNTHQVQADQTFILDAGCEVRNACSDHTRTFPTGTKFTKRQEELYRVVLAANKTGIEHARPGAKWEDVHFASLKTLLIGLRELGLVRAELSVDEQFEAGVPSVFQPHGLGHMLGLNTHDVGGYNSEIKKSTTDWRIKYLRTRRTLQAGMVITVEPGIYFIKGMLETAKNDEKLAKHINFDVVAQYQKECGGYRIEDDVLITPKGCEVLPGPVKEVDEIYALRTVAYVK